MTESRLNDDGVSVKGCNMIYAPRGQALEYSALAANPYRGCGHGCAYCYVPDVIKMSRPDFDAGATPRPDYLKHLMRDAARYRSAGVTEQVMLSFTTDPYHPGDSTLTRETLKVLRHHGLGFCTLTKGGTRALRDLDLFRSSRDAFATTLTTLDNDFSLKWERNAALPGDRLEALYRFHKAGIYTWVSVEPTLDVEASLAIVEVTHPYVDLFKIGRANYVPTITKVVNWQSYTLRMLEVLQRLGNSTSFYFKKDLQRYLPPGLPNPLRVPQHFGAGA